MSFQKKLEKIIRINRSLVCIGLDSDIEKLPSHLRKKSHPQFAFNKAIIDATADLVCAYKPNTAFYEARGAEGIRELKMTCDYLVAHHPDIPIILDAKRGDIGNTNNGYIAFAYDYLKVDAITLHPYLGEEALRPFLDRKDKGCIILCKTSNKGSGELQNLLVSGNIPLYQHVARQIVEKWNKNKNCMLVVGATYPEELKEVRNIVGNMWILVPGMGAQGGDLKATLDAGLTKDRTGLIINSSRSIIFASNGKDFAKVVGEEARKLQLAINEYR